MFMIDTYTHVVGDLALDIVLKASTVLIPHSTQMFHPRHLNPRHRPIDIRLNLPHLTLQEQLLGLVEILHRLLKLMPLNLGDPLGQEQVIQGVLI